MGLFENLLGGTGVAIHPSQLAAMQQQQAFNPLSQIQAQYPQMTLLEKYNLAHAMQGMMPFCSQPPRRHVESREVTPRERARKQINGAVQAVKDAQIAAKS